MDDTGLKRQSDIEELSAWMDGELPEQQAERVARLVETDSDWQATFEQFRAVDRAADLLEPARPAPDLAERIVRLARRRRGLVRMARIAAPLAAAACIAVALWLGIAQFDRTRPHRPVGTDTGRIASTGDDTGNRATTGLEAQIATVLKDLQPEDRFIVRQLPLFRNYDQVTQYQKVSDLADAETLSALAALDNTKEM